MDRIVRERRLLVRLASIVERTRRCPSFSPGAVIEKVAQHD
jgi:hypothetical protein